MCKKCWDRAKAKMVGRGRCVTPSEKEPDNALSDSFGFCPLSPADSSPRGRAEKKALASPFGRGGKSVGFFGEGYYSLSQQADSSLNEGA